MNKLTVVGKGLSGMLSVNFFNNIPNWEIECFYNGNYPEQDVGISTPLDFYAYMGDINNLRYPDIKEFKGHHKTGVSKENFGGNTYFQSFRVGQISVHFNSVDMINYLYKLNENIKYNELDGNVNYEDLNTDYIIDTTRPEHGDMYEYPKHIPVNTSHGTRIKWSYPSFDYTRLIARPYGWIGMIPTAEYVFCTYTFNSNINSIDDIESDMKEFLLSEAYSIEDLKFKTFPFKNYYIKEPVQGNVFYNGNKCSFLEPFEATSISNTLRITSNYFEHLMYSQPFYTQRYLDYIQESQEVILMHYLAGSKWDTPFWKQATANAEVFFMTESSEKLKYRIEKISKPYLKIDTISFFYSQELYNYNIFSLGVYEKLKQLVSH